MLKKINLNQYDLPTLHNFRETLETFVFAAKPVGEQFHHKYRKDKVAFKKFVKETVRLNTNLNNYFKNQWNHIEQLVRLYKISADEVEDQFINIAYWQEDDKTFAATIQVNIGEMFNIGAAAAEALFNVDIGLDKNDLEVQKFLRDYTLQLAGQINTTTKNKIVEQIKTSLALGENRDGLIARLEPIVKDRKRAVRIAQTESIRAYSEGNLSVGKRIGIKKKKWFTALDPCPICAEFNGKIIPIDDLFGGRVAGPPAHPHCRCLVELVYDPDKDTIDWKNTGTNLEY